MAHRKFSRGTGLTKQTIVEISDDGDIDEKPYSLPNIFEIIPAFVSSELENDEGQEAEPDSRLGYARRMDNALAIMDTAKETNSHGLIVSCAFELGRLWEQFGWKFEHEADALVGKKVVKHSPDGGKQRGNQIAAEAAIRHGQWRGWAKEVWAKNARLSPAEVARRIKKRHRIDDHYKTIAKCISLVKP